MKPHEIRDRSSSTYELADSPRGDEHDTMSVSEFKATCLRVLEQIRTTGRPLLITKRGTPLAQVLPPPTPPPRADAFGCMAGSAEELEDITEPLDPEDWEVLR